MSIEQQPESTDTSKAEPQKPENAHSPLEREKLDALAVVRYRNQLAARLRAAIPR